jgi:hypothetical protein
VGLFMGMDRYRLKAKGYSAVGPREGRPSICS